MDLRKGLFYFLRRIPLKIFFYLVQKQHALRTDATQSRAEPPRLKACKEDSFYPLLSGKRMRFLLQGFLFQLLSLSKEALGL